MNKNKLKETNVKHQIGKLQMNLYKDCSGTSYHWHDEYEFIWVTDGECECVINGSKYNLKNGQAILVKGGELHSVKSDKIVKFCAIVFHPYLICGSGESEFFSNRIKFQRVYDSDKERQIFLDLMDIWNGFCKRYYGFELKLKSLLIDIFSYIYENNLYSIQNTSNTGSFENILEYVHEHYAEKISLEDIAKYVGFTSTYIITLFKKYTGKTPIEYINSYRIYKAEYLLENTEKTILEISLECGFENVGYFIRVFKNNIKTTPHQYRIKMAESKS